MRNTMRLEQTVTETRLNLRFSQR
uniref:Uncharacterized protein n=1 Tax=Lotus japonicus TaxID=34305 RepID=I3S6Q5_LOTJA|nr:unknown [Lotus japonicus]